MMMRKKLTQRVNLEKLTKDDFRFRGEFRVVEQIYQNWRIKPEFKQEGTDTYIHFDELLSQDKFHQCYELIIQTPDSTQVVGSGFLHKDQSGDVSFSCRSGFHKPEERFYFNSSPVWFSLVDDCHEPIVEGVVDLIFVKASSGESERDTQRQRVLYG